ncbi:hypothetical protein GCM10028807_32610 [Spirosoma daeguense]
MKVAQSFQQIISSALVGKKIHVWKRIDQVKGKEYYSFSSSNEQPIVVTITEIGGYYKSKSWINLYFYIEEKMLFARFDMGYDTLDFVN